MISVAALLGHGVVGERLLELGLGSQRDWHGGVEEVRKETRFEIT